MIKSENSDNLKIFGKIVDKLHLVLYNKLTKKNKRKEGQITPLEYQISGNPADSQISEFKYTKIAVHFH